MTVDPIIDQALFKRLAQLIQRTAGFAEEKVSLDTDIRKDVGLWGDDAYNFMTAFMNEFGVDMTGFVFQDFFEGEGMVANLIGSVLGMQRKHKPLTVAVLVDVAQWKHWTI